MESPVNFRKLAADVWLAAYPLKVLGVDLHRNVTLIRLKSGKLIIHSTAPFTQADVQVIRGFGDPAWLVECLLRHDTFAVEGGAAFPEVRYLVPPGFEMAGVDAVPLLPPPSEWEGEVETLLVEGVPAFGEVVMLHVSSRTLIVGDLLFNFPGESNLWKKSLLALGCVGGKFDPGVSKPFKAAIKDEAALTRSLRKILAWDFDRIVVGHGQPVSEDATEQLREAFKRIGLRNL